MKSAACNTILTYGGTISHQHGVGTDHAPFMVREKGQVGINLLNSIFNWIDPDHILNPGKLIS
jgi:alkyldihydroxyacetonephosphate synthase